MKATVAAGSKQWIPPFLGSLLTYFLDVAIRLEEETMDFDADIDRFSQPRRGFVRASARTTLGLMVGAMLPAEAFSATRSTRGIDAVNRGDNGVTLPLQEISDRIEIEELLVRYCYAVDDRDWDAYRNIFTSDAVLDDTVTGGIKSGVEEHVAYLQRALSKILISQHAISTVLIDLRGDEASARLHCSCPMVVDLGDGKRQVFFQGLWYRNEVVRTQEGWRISELIEEGYWNYNLPDGFRF